MTAPTTLPEALSEIEELRVQVCDLLRLLGQEARMSAADVIKTEGQHGIILNARDITEHKRTEALLWLSEGKIRQVLKAATIGLWEWNTETNEVLFSREWKSQLGYEEGELPDTFETWEHRLHPDDHARAIAYAQDYRANPEGEYRQEFRLRHKDGTYRWIEACASFMTEPDGRRVRLLGSHTDITERKRSEQALRQEHALREAILNASIDMMYVKDLDGRYVHMNQAGAKALGMPIDEIVGWDDVGLWGSELAASCCAGDRRVIESGETISVEESSTGEGKTTIYLTTKAPYRDPDGRIIGVIGVSRDITARVQVEQELRKSEARLKEAQRLAHIGSWELDLTTNRLDWSDEMYRIFELERDRFGASYEAFLSVVHPDDRSAVHRAYTDSVRDHTPYELVHRLLMPDGRVKYVQERCETIYDPQGAPQRSFGTVQDVSERMRLAEREVVRTEQLKRLSELGLTLSGDPAEIFERVVRMLGELFKVRVVCLSEIVGSELQFKAVYCNGQVVRDAGHCPLAVTPCATVEQDKDLRLFDRVMERFPRDSFLRDHQAVSYCGFPALDAQGRVVAVTCLLDDKPHVFTAEDQELLRVFSQRIAIEIERARYLADQQRQADELQQSHTFIRQIVDTIPNFIFAKDRDGRFILANKAVAEAYGTTVENLIGKTDADFNPHAEEVQVFRQKDREVMDTLQEWFTPEEKITDAAGKVRWLQTVKRPILDNEGLAHMVVGAATDITERKRMEEMLRQREWDLRQALDERERISQDLHDGILQSIYAVGLGLESCKMLLSAPPHQRKKSDGQLQATFECAIGQLNRLMAEVRNFIAGLESQVLQGVDFATAMRSMIKSMSTAGISCRLTIDETAARCISTEQAFHLLNVAREALSNSLRHANATRISVSLKRLTRSVRLSITDDGVGFEPATAQGVGHGLANMAARVRKMMGRLALRSNPRRGTKIVVDLPEKTVHAIREA